MATLETVTIEVTDTAAAARFHEAVLGSDPRVRTRASEAATSGFRGFTLSLVLAQPADVDSLVAGALEAGATELRPAAKSLWGYGGAFRAPDGTIWTVASQSKRATGQATGQIDDLVLQLGVTEVAASRQFYAERGFTVAKSYGRRYVEIGDPSSPVTMTLNRRKALAKVAGVDADGSGSHRLVLGSDAGAFTDPDGFVGESGL